MTLVAFAQWALAGLGIIYLLTGSTIFSGPRVTFARNSPVRAELIYCPACTGFWVGLLLGTIGLFPTTPHGPLADAVQSGFSLMALGALWGRYGPTGPFEDEMEEVFPEIRESDDQAQESEDE